MIGLASSSRMMLPSILRTTSILNPIKVSTRFLQTTADSSSLASPVPSSSTEVFQVKLHQVSFNSHTLDL